MWEDEKIHPTDLQVTEIGLITKMKEKAFKTAY
jgi:hypothetical protein